MQAIETLEYRNMNIKIYQDGSPANPRKYWDNFGKMVCAHSRYDLGDKAMSAEDIMALTERKDVLYLPLYLYDHSGLSMNTGGFNCPWDSGQVGIIYADRGVILKEYGVKKITAKIKAKVYALLRAEVETYNQYLTGDVYGYEVEDPGNEVEGDSCWSLYGFQYAIDEAKAIAAYMAGQRAKSTSLAAMERHLDTQPDVLMAGERLQAGAV